MNDEKLSPGPWEWKSAVNGGGERDWWLVDLDGAEIMGCEGCENARLEVKRPADRRALGAAWEMAKLLESVAEVCGPKFNSYPAAQELAERAADLLKRIQEE